METSAPEKCGKNFRLHNVQFYVSKPRGIVSLAFNKLLNLVAVGRDDGSIEIWDFEYAPHLQHVIPQPPDCQAENLAWAGNRLFSVSLNGKLVEWDLSSLEPRCEQLLTGNALWCLDVNPENTELAVGSEEGYINIMNIEHNEITYKTLFPKQKDRILCCKFDRTGLLLVTGSIGTVCIWEVSKGTVRHTMTLSAPNVIVWSLLVLSDLTIIAGDSAGYATFWEGRNATQIEAYKVLNKNLLALAISDNEDQLICSGMDPPLIRILAKTTIKREETYHDRWIKFIQKDIHTHYVKAIVMMMGDRFVSGGQDGNLCVTSVKKHSCYHAKYAPFLRNPCVSLAPTNKHILLRYPTALHLWRLGSEKPRKVQMNEQIKKCEALLLDEMPEKLLQIRTDNKLIMAAAISADSSWICYASATDIKIYRLVLDAENRKNNLSAERITNNLPTEFQPATRIIFMKDNKHMFLLHGCTRQLSCFRLTNDKVNFAYKVDLSMRMTGPITYLEISECGTYIAAASSDYIVAVWRLNNGKRHEHLVSLPRYKAATTGMALHPTQPLLAVAYADGRIVEYNLAERCFKYEGSPKTIKETSIICIRGIMYVAEHPILIVFTENRIHVLKKVKCAADEKQPGGKAKRLSQNENVWHNRNTPELRLKLKYSVKRKHIVEVCRLGADELVTVGVHLNSLTALLPAPVERKKFGKS